VKLALALAGGLALPLSLAPFDWRLADVVSIAALFVALRGVRAARAAWIGWAFGLGKYGLGASWVYVSIHEYGHATPLLAGALVALFVALLALFPAIMAVAFAAIRDWKQTSREVPVLREALAFAGCWVALEWVLTWALTGFPWLYAGYAHLGDPLRHYAPVGGVLLVSLAAAVGAVAIVAAALERTRAARALALCVALLPWLGGLALGEIEWTQPGPGGRVALVQGAIPQDHKWVAEHTRSILDTYRHLSAPHWQNDLVIWPEAAVTLFEHQADGYLREMSARARAGGAGLVLGIPAAERQADGSWAFLNAAIAIGRGEGRYVKRRLVPFGEYVPLERVLRGAIGFFDLPMSHAVSGPWRQAPLRAGEWRLAMAICYEIVYPDLVRVSAAESDVIVTLSNDAWFGGSIGPHQHLQMARMRALENGRFVLRATNNGITAIVDPAGRITARLPQFEPAVLTGAFGVPEGRPPFARLGSTPALALVVLLLLLVRVGAHPRVASARGYTDT
jgi:apolipoprotein N-acyltransferase